MSITITLPEEIEARLQRKAETQQRSVEEVAIDLLNSIVEQDESVPRLGEIVRKIQGTPPDPHNIRPAEGSLAAALRNAPEDPDFALVVWEREWAAAEAEMQAITRANDIAEGHR